MSSPRCSPKNHKDDKSLSPAVTKTSPSTKLNCSFIDYLDQTNCRLTGPTARKKILMKSPKKAAQQLKIDFTAKENVKNSHKNEHDANTCKREPLSPVNKKKDIEMQEEDIDFEIDENEKRDVGDIDVEITHEKGKEKRSIFYIEENEKESEDDELLCENTFEDDEKASQSSNTSTGRLMSDGEDPVIPDVLRTPEICHVKKQSNDRVEIDSHHESEDVSTQELDEQPIATSQESLTSTQELSQNSKQKLKIGLSKFRCNGRGASSYVGRAKTTESPQKITRMLEKLKDLPKDKESKYSDSCPNFRQTEECSESVLTPSLPLSLEHEFKVRGIFHSSFKVSICIVP